MERGPLALFGAIVAVGLGPALWMGVQLGPSPQPGPARAPVVNEQGAEKAGQELIGGTGAGEQTSDSTTIDADPQGNVLPLTTSPTAEPSPSTSTIPKPPASTTSPTPEPTPATTEPTTPSDPGTTEPTSPTESTTAPTTDPTDTTEPPVEDETTAPTHPSEDWPGDDPDPYGGTVGKYVASDEK